MKINSCFTIVIIIAFVCCIAAPQPSLYAVKDQYIEQNIEQMKEIFPQQYSKLINRLSQEVENLTTKPQDEIKQFFINACRSFFNIFVKQLSFGTETSDELFMLAFTRIPLQEERTQIVKNVHAVLWDPQSDFSQIVLAIEKLLNQTVVTNYRNACIIHLAEIINNEWGAYQIILHIGELPNVIAQALRK